MEKVIKLRAQLSACTDVMELLILRRCAAISGENSNYDLVFSKVVIPGHAVLDVGVFVRLLLHLAVKRLPVGNGEVAIHPSMNQDPTRCAQWTWIKQRITQGLL